MEVDVGQSPEPTRPGYAGEVPERVGRRDGVQQLPRPRPDPRGRRERCPGLAAREIRRTGRPRGAVHVAELGTRVGNVGVRVPAAAAEERRRESHVPEPRTLEANARTRLVPVRPLALLARSRIAGRPCVVGSGPVRVVAERPPCRGLAGALEPHALVLPGRRVGRSHERCDPNPPGRRRCSAEKRAHTSSSSGRSTWQETTAYRSADVPRMLVDATADS